MKNYFLLCKKQAVQKRECGQTVCLFVLFYQLDIKFYSFLCFCLLHGKSSIITWMNYFVNVDKSFLLQGTSFSFLCFIYFVTFIFNLRFLFQLAKIKHKTIAF